MPPINQVILIIIFAEFIFTVGGSLINPVFALFVTQNVGAPITALGFAISIYWITKSILQLPVARYLDKNHGELDDYYAIIGGLALTTIAVYLYYFVNSIWQIYFLQVLSAIGDSFIIPPLFAIFARHLDRDQEAFEGALRSSFSYGAGAALGSALSGILATIFGIRPIFLINGTFLFIGLIILLFLRPYIRPRAAKEIKIYT